MRRSFRLEWTYPHPMEKVWGALTDREALSAWLMPTANFLPEVGHRFEFHTGPGPGFDGVVHCRVLAVEAPHSMTWSWRGGPVDTTVSFQLERVGPASTRLVLTQSGFIGARSVLVSYILSSGARRIYGRQLPAYLAGSRGSETDWRPPAQSPLLAVWHKVVTAAVAAAPRRKV